MDAVAWPGMRAAIKQRGEREAAARESWARGNTTIEQHNKWEAEVREEAAKARRYAARKEAELEAWVAFRIRREHDAEEAKRKLDKAMTELEAILTGAVMYGAADKNTKLEYDAARKKCQDAEIAYLTLTT